MGSFSVAQDTLVLIWFVMVQITHGLVCITVLESLFWYGSLYVMFKEKRTIVTSKKKKGNK